MKQRKIDLVKRFAAMALTAATVFMTAACGSEGSNVNLVESQEGNERIVKSVQSYGKNGSGCRECGKKRCR